VDAILLLCTGTFPQFKSDRLIVQPQEALYHHHARARRRRQAHRRADAARGSARAGAVEVARVRRRPLLAAASPYSGADEVYAAARDLAERGAELIFMDCMGYSLGMKARAKAAAGGCPVILARSAIARVLAEVAG